MVAHAFMGVSTSLLASSDVHPRRPYHLRYYRPASSPSRTSEYSAPSKVSTLVSAIVFSPNYCSVYGVSPQLNQLSTASSPVARALLHTATTRQVGRSAYGAMSHATFRPRRPRWSDYIGLRQVYTLSELPIPGEDPE